MPILDTEKSDVHLRGKGEKVHDIHFRLVTDLHYYFQTTCALLENLENFDNIDRILYITFESSPTPQNWYDPLGQKVEL